MSVWGILCICVIKDKNGQYLVTFLIIEIEVRKLCSMTHLIGETPLYMWSTEISVQYHAPNMYQNTYRKWSHQYVGVLSIEYLMSLEGQFSTIHRHHYREKCAPLSFSSTPGKQRNRNDFISLLSWHVGGICHISTRHYGKRDNFNFPLIDSNACNTNV